MPPYNGVKTNPKARHPTSAQALPLQAVTVGRHRPPKIGHLGKDDFQKA